MDELTIFHARCFRTRFQRSQKLENEKSISYGSSERFRVWARMVNLEHHTGLHRFLILNVIARLLFFCGVCSLGVNCWYQQFECPGYDYPITTWDGIGNSIEALILTTAFVACTLVVPHGCCHIRVQAMYKVEDERRYQVRSSLVTIRWLAMESASYGLIFLYGLLQLRIFGGMPSLYISEDPILSAEDVSLETICFTLKWNRQKMGRMSPSSKGKSTALFCLMVVPLLSFLLCVIFLAKWRTAKKMQQGKFSNESPNTTAENQPPQEVESAPMGIVRVRAVPQSTFRVRHITELDTGPWETVPVELVNVHNVTAPVSTSIQNDPPSEEIAAPTVNQDPDVPPSYESVLKTNTQHSTTC